MVSMMLAHKGFPVVQETALYSVINTSIK